MLPSGTLVTAACELCLNGAPLRSSCGVLPVVASLRCLWFPVWAWSFSPFSSWFLASGCAIFSFGLSRSGPSEPSAEEVGDGPLAVRLDSTP